MQSVSKNCVRYESKDQRKEEITRKSVLARDGRGKILVNVLQV
jgi:hypothetical protein